MPRVIQRQIQTQQQNVHFIDHRNPDRMVVLAASICTRGGKAILSRQFRDLHKDQVLTLLASFPKLTQSGAQHTTVEDENVRYVYQPLEELYVVLITNRQSNILQDIDTLRLLSQVVSSLVRVVDEREVLAKAFDILSAFDEVVNLGYRENLNMSQIMTFLEMESHEEKIQEIIERNKELEAAEERKKKAKQLEMQRREASKRGVNGIGSGYGNGPSSYTAPTYTAPVQQVTNTNYGYEERAAKKPSRPLRGKGLQLGKKKPGLPDSEESPLMATELPPAAAVPNYFEPESAAPSNKGIEIVINENLSAVLGRDGSIKSSQAKGNVQLRVGDPELGRIKILTNTSGDAQYQTNPNIDKQQFATSKILALRDASKSFPSNNQQLEVMRWKLIGKADDSTLVPLTFNCWFSQTESSFYDVTMEYEIKSDFGEVLRDVTVAVPLVSTNVHVSPDSPAAYTVFDDHLEWIIPEIDPQSSSSSGSFEFTAEADAEDEFFPVDIQFNVKDSLSNYGKVDILDIVSANDESNSLPFDKSMVVVSEKYRIE